MENKKIISLERELLKLGSVKKIISSNNINLSVMQGELCLVVTGHNLSIVDFNLETGVLTATGDIEKLEYKKEINGKTLIKKLFK